MVKAIALLIAFLAGPLLTATAAAQSDDPNRMNFQDRRAEIINNAPNYLELRNFKFENRFQNSRFRAITNLEWQNKSSQPIVAFEVVILQYDPFNRPIRGGGRWLVTGRSSGDWRPLAPGATGSDGLIGTDTEPVMTAIVYVRAIRFQDGSVWNFEQERVASQVRQRLPAIRDIGDLNPQAPPNDRW